MSSTAPGISAQDKGLHAGEGQLRLILDKKWDKDDQELRVFLAYRRDPLKVQITPEILDHAAQWFAYRFTHDEFYKDVKPGAKAMHDLLKEALEQVVDPHARKVPEEQLQFKEQFDKRFVARLQEVTKNPKPIARHNAVMVLARLAASGDEDAVAVLTDVVNDPKENDGIKLFAFRGIADFFKLGQGDNPTPFKNKELEKRCIKSLLDYVGRKPAVDEDLPADQKAAAHYIRRDAIAALGETRYPGLAKTENKKTTIELPTALTLLRIVRKDGDTPIPDEDLDTAARVLEEQVNAAVGVCRLRSKALEQYHVDYAAELLGRFIVDFVTEYDSDRLKELKVPWKLFATRLIKALEEFKADAEGRQEAKYLANVVGESEDMLKAISEGSKPNAAKFVAWLDQNKAKKAFVYEGMPDSVIRTTGKAKQ
jgi:hypothetical protein